MPISGRTRRSCGRAVSLPSTTSSPARRSSSAAFPTSGPACAKPIRSSSSRTGVRVAAESGSYGSEVRSRPMVRDRLRDLVHRPWRNTALPSDATGIPTMLSKMERRVLYSLARDYASGDAAIVDAGSFLGGSTAALLAGVRDRSEPWSGPPVASYDLFRIDRYMVAKFFSEDGSLRVGDSFRPQFDAGVARFDVPHVVHEGDITEIGWSGGPIDVLFLDILKSWEINDAVLRDFFPALVPGRSV